MKNVNAIIRQQAYEKISEALAAIGVVGVTVTQCKGFDLEGNDMESASRIHQLIELDVVVKDSRLDDVVELIAATMLEYRYGDGELIIKTMDDAIRIRDKLRGDEVL